eukprot:7810147-Ditylum_brightwellii.AAC.1
MGHDKECPVTIKFVDHLLARNSELADFVTYSSVDPVRVDKVTDEAHDALFAKVDAYTTIVISMKKIDKKYEGFGGCRCKKKIQCR